jgi:ribosome-binding factor A
MSQRTQKVASLVQQAVAAELSALPEAAYLTVTKVDVTPDLRSCTVWIGVLAPRAATTAAAMADRAFAAAQATRDQLQAAVARRLTTKFVPRLTLERDTAGEYAEHIDRLIRGL